MQPITYAKIKFWSITLSYVPIAVWLAAKATWYARKTNEAKINEIWAKVDALKADRIHEVRRCYAYHTNGYEFVGKIG
jgi:hypothetical protein